MSSFDVPGLKPSLASAEHLRGARRDTVGKAVDYLLALDNADHFRLVRP